MASQETLGTGPVGRRKSSMAMATSCSTKEGVEANLGPQRRRSSAAASAPAKEGYEEHFGFPSGAAPGNVVLVPSATPGEDATLQQEQQAFLPAPRIEEQGAAVASETKTAGVAAAAAVEGSVELTATAATLPPHGNTVFATAWQEVAGGVPTAAQGSRYPGMGSLPPGEEEDETLRQGVWHPSGNPIYTVS